MGAVDAVIVDPSRTGPSLHMPPSRSGKKFAAERNRGVIHDHVDGSDDPVSNRSRHRTLPAPKALGSANVRTLPYLAASASIFRPNEGDMTSSFCICT